MKYRKTRQYRRKRNRVRRPRIRYSVVSNGIVIEGDGKNVGSKEYKDEMNLRRLAKDTETSLRWKYVTGQS